MTATELREHREGLQAALESGHLHLLSVLRKPEKVLASTPVGDVLSWALDEAKAARVLAAAEIDWSRRLGSLTKRESTLLCGWVKTHHPETWERWRASLRGRKP